MVESALSLRPLTRASFKRLLAYGMWVILGLHAVVLVAVHPSPAATSRILTSLIPIMAGICCLWRTRRLHQRERATWFWASGGLFLWGIAHLIETFISHSVAASNLTVDPSDFIYITATFPLLVALSTTRETESIHALFVLNCAQIVLALLLSYILLYRMSLTSAAASTVMGGIYGSACVLLAVMALLRMFTWRTQEERHSVRWLSAVLWAYLPVELGMDYATAHWNLQAGTLIDLVWSFPFMLGGLKALYIPIAEPPAPKNQPVARLRSLVEALCPMLMTAGVFALAAAIARQHIAIGLSAVFLLLTIQATHAALVQLNYRDGRYRLLEREQELRKANRTLRELSLQDPLTGIANRRHFNAALETAWRRAIRKGQPLALLIVDIDFFKGVNDLHGHSYGDECLVSVAQVMQHYARRPDDAVARLGGEEFVLLLPDTLADGAMAVAAHIHECISEMGVTNNASPFEKRLTVSIGIGIAAPSPVGALGALIDCADQALYEAKGQGRNRTCARNLQ